MQRYEHRELNEVAVRAKGGDSAARELLIRLLEPTISSHAYKTNIPGMDVDDIKQEVRLAILAKLPFYDPRRDLLPYVLPIIRTVIGTILRSQGRLKRAAELETVPLTGREAAKLTAAPVESIQSRIEAVGSLEEVLIAGLFAEGHSRKEVARIAGVTVWAVRAAMKSLRVKLGDDVAAHAKYRRTERRVSAATPEGGKPLRWEAGE
jgi:RNA polymerase sigma factor (sigma-70 family)